MGGGERRVPRLDQLALALREVTMERDEEFHEAARQIAPGIEIRRRMVDARIDWSPGHAIESSVERRAAPGAPRRKGTRPMRARIHREVIGTGAAPA